MLHHCFGITRFLIDFVALRSKCPQLSSIKQVDEIGNNLRLYRTQRGIINATVLCLYHILYYQ